jgi:NhaP-type Na+/H+ or K+/H+ antiporter
MLAHVSEAFVFIYLGMAVFTYKNHQIQWTNVFCVLVRVFDTVPRMR